MFVAYKRNKFWGIGERRFERWIMGGGWKKFGLDGWVEKIARKKLGSNESEIFVTCRGKMALLIPKLRKVFKFYGDCEFERQNDACFLKLKLSEVSRSRAR